MKEDLKKIFLWSMWNKPNVLRLWAYLLITACDEDCIVNDVQLKRGQVLTSVNDLTHNTGLTTSQVRTSLKDLANRQLVVGLSLANRHTLLTICNYDSYICYRFVTSQTNRKPIANQEKENNEEDTRKEINENERFLPPNPLSSKEKENKEKKTEEGTKEKEDEKVITQNACESEKPKQKRFVPPTLEEVKTYVKEKDYKFDPEMFFYHYTSNGWMTGKTPVKNWKACCGTWSRRDNNTNQTIVANTNAKEENDALLLQFDAGDYGYGGFIHYIADNAPNVVQNVKLPNQQEFETITKQHRQHFAAALQLMNGYSRLSTTTFFSAFIRAIQDIKKTIDYGTLQQQNKQFADRVFAEDMRRVIERDARIARETPDVPL